MKTLKNIFKTFARMGLTALVSTAFFVLTAATTQAAYIEVNANTDGLANHDHSFFSPVAGQEELTLREAIELTRGDIPMGNLNPDECDQIKNADGDSIAFHDASDTCVWRVEYVGTPDAVIGSGGDAITFDLAVGNTVITPVDSVYPEFTTNDVTVDGGGTVTISGADINLIATVGLYGLKFDGVDGGTIQGLTFTDFSYFDAAAEEGSSAVHVFDSENVQIGVSGDVTTGNYFLNSYNAVMLEEALGTMVENNYIGNDGTNGNSIYNAANNVFPNGVVILQGQENEIRDNFIGGNVTNIHMDQSMLNIVEDNAIGVIPTDASQVFENQSYGVLLTGGTSVITIENNIFAGLEIAGVYVADATSNENVARFNTYTNMGATAEQIVLNGSNPLAVTPVITSATNNSVTYEVDVPALSDVYLDFYVASETNEAANLINDPATDPVVLSNASATTTTMSGTLSDVPFPVILRYVTGNATVETLTGQTSSSEFTFFENDTDEDGLTNAAEAVWGTDPTNPDTDGDGYLDGDEDTNSDGDNVDDAADESDPTQPCSTPLSPDGCTTGDDDGDGIVNGSDNCPTIPNADQADNDADGTGDACDDDDDDDGVLDVNDNCQFVANPTQDDADGDGLGDACDPDSGNPDTDGDGVNDGLDNCVSIPNADQLDTDGDGSGDVCDSDDDGDGVDDGVDNCPLVSNPSQTDNDGDGIGAACDTNDGTDTDGDGFNDDADNCPLVSNSSQLDGDGDGLGDACDPVTGVDTDGDGHQDDVDNCPGTPNPSQADEDGDGTGDACQNLPFSTTRSSGGGGGFAAPRNYQGEGHAGEGFLPEYGAGRFDNPFVPNGDEPVVTTTEPTRTSCSLLDISRHWSNEYVTELCELGVVSGYGRSNMYGPNNEINRAEFVKMLITAMGEEVDEDARTFSFSDVSPYQWYAPYVAKARELGIVNGYNDGTFKPNNVVTRAEAVKMVLAAMDERPSYSGSRFSDMGNHWANGWVATAEDQNIVNGLNPFQFGPDNSLRRGEAAKIVVNGLMN